MMGIERGCSACNACSACIWGRKLRRESDFRTRRFLDLFSNSDKYLQRVRLAVRVARTRGAVWSGV